MSRRRKIKLLLYCHNALGLGHIIRSVQIAEAAGRTRACECRIITGCRFLGRMKINAGVGVEELPPVGISEGGRFEAVDGGISGVGGVGSAGEGGEGIMGLRGRRIEEFTRAWSPDVFLTDHNPLGLGGELLRTLTSARREGWRTRFVWGLRDIQVAPEHAARMVRRPRNPEIREALGSYYGAIGYSDKNWIDTFETYRDWELPARLDYVGVVARGATTPTNDEDANEVPVVVGLSGGGAGGERLFGLLLRAALPLVEAGTVRLRIVVGPFGSADALDIPEAARARVEVLAESSVEDAVRDASVVVSRVGYNTAYTLAQAVVPLVFVPYPAPGDEQLYRARMLARLPNVSVVEERSTEAAELLRENIRRGLGAARVERQLPFRVDGAERAAEWLLQASPERSGGH